MPDPDQPPATDPPETDDQAGLGRARGRRWRRAVPVAVVVIIAALGGTVAWWQHSGRYVGTEVPTELRFRGCLNSLSWSDPVAGEWWAGNFPVHQGPLVSEPVTLRPLPANGRPLPMSPGPGVPHRQVELRAMGTMRFDSRGHATFTNRAGGTFELVRPQDAHLAHCASVPHPTEGQPPPVQAPSPTGLWGTIQGYVARAVPGGDAEIVDARVRVADASGTVAETPAGSTGHRFWVAPGTYTLVATIDGGAECRLEGVVVEVGADTPADVICPVR